MPLADKVIWHLESSLNVPLSLAELANRCSVSPYHMSRIFRTTTGLSPMTYLRARRLSAAADRLALGELDILTIALDAQYNSHEAFTRAFAGYFGVLPNRVRTSRSTRDLTLMEPLHMKKDLIVDVPAHDIKERAGFRVVGIGTSCTFENTSAIPSLWQTFNEREVEVSSAILGTAYGVSCDADGAGRFRYVAGVEAPQDAEIPSGMDDVSIPAGRYAVFTHSGHISDLPKTVYTIWNKSLPDAGLNPREAPDFELYDRRFDPLTGRGDVEIWIPIA